MIHETSSQAGQFICNAIRVPDADEISYVGSYLKAHMKHISDVNVTKCPVDITPFPDYEKEFHYGFIACSEPGYTATGEQEAWNCMQNTQWNRIRPVPGLVSAGWCAPDSQSETLFQYQGGAGEETAMRSPPGTGFAVGGDTGFQWLVLYSHFPYGSSDNMTTDSSLQVTTKTVTSDSSKQSVSMRGWHQILMEAKGVIGAHSTGWVQGYYTIDEDVTLHLVQLYIHFHRRFIRSQTYIIRALDGSQQLISQQDVDYKGMIDLTPNNLTMSRGDKLMTRCWIDNEDNEEPLLMSVDCCLCSCLVTLTNDSRRSQDPGGVQHSCQLLHR